MLTVRRLWIFHSISWGLDNYHDKAVRGRKANARLGHACHPDCKVSCAPSLAYVSQRYCRRQAFRVGFRADRNSRHPLRQGTGGALHGMHAVRSLGRRQDFPLGLSFSVGQRHLYTGIDAHRRI